jgi:hypothetical protein
MDRGGGLMMGLLDLFRRSQNPTSDWERPPGLQLTFDLESSALNGVALGQPLASLSFLGPAEDRTSVLCGEYGYFSLGLVVDCHNDKNVVDGFELVNRDLDASRYQAFVGDCRCGGAGLRLDRVTPTFLQERFGPPYWKNEDDDETILFYEFPGVEWQVELGPEARLNRIVVTNEILMADEVQRANYGVTKGWPPDYAPPQ